MILDRQSGAHEDPRYVLTGALEEIESKTKIESSVIGA